MPANHIILIFTQYIHIFSENILDCSVGNAPSLLPSPSRLTDLPHNYIIRKTEGGHPMEKDMEQYIEKLRRYYDSDNRLTQYPSKKPMRILALIQIALKISPERKYTEKEVNRIIRDSITFSDIELIRREMFQYRLIGRLRDGSEYWSEPDWKTKYEAYL